jgi:hypothetical protein
VDGKEKKVAQEKQTADRNLRGMRTDKTRKRRGHFSPKANWKTNLLLRPNGFETVLPRVAGFSVTPPFALMLNQDTNTHKHRRAIALCGLSAIILTTQGPTREKPQQRHCRLPSTTRQP